MKIFFSEIIGDKWKYYSIEHDNRHLFWKEHHLAKEVSRKEYEEMMKYTLSQKEEIKTEINEKG